MGFLDIFDFVGDLANLFTDKYERANPEFEKYHDKIHENQTRIRRTDDDFANSYDSSIDNEEASYSVGVF